MQDRISLNNLGSSDSFHSENHINGNTKILAKINESQICEDHDGTTTMVQDDITYL